MTNGLYLITGLDSDGYTLLLRQVHRVTSVIQNAMEANQYCTAPFLDISQAFDKVWHEGLLCKLKTLFPDSIYQTLISYLANRHFLIKFRERHMHPFAQLYLACRRAAYWVDSSTYFTRLTYLLRRRAPLLLLQTILPS
jgi:hypothetical protein